MRLPAGRWLRVELYPGLFDADGEVLHACRWTATRASLSDWQTRFSVIQIKAGDGINWNDFTRWFARGFSEKM